MSFVVAAIIGALVGMAEWLTVGRRRHALMNKLRVRWGLPAMRCGEPGLAMAICFTLWTAMLSATAGFLADGVLSTAGLAALIAILCHAGRWGLAVQPVYRLHRRRRAEIVDF